MTTLDINELQPLVKGLNVSHLSDKYKEAYKQYILNKESKYCSTYLIGVYETLELIGFRGSDFEQFRMQVLEELNR